MHRTFVVVPIKAIVLNNSTVEQRFPFNGDAWQNYCQPPADLPD